MTVPGHRLAIVTTNPPASQDKPAAAQSSEAWSQLATTAGALPTQDAPWATAGFATFPGEPAVFTIGSPESPEALAALIDSEGWLEPVAVSAAGEPTDLLARTPQALAGLAEAIARDSRPLRIPRIAVDSPALAALEVAYRRRGWLRKSPAESFPTIELDERWAEPGGGLSSSRRSALRRSRRKAEERGEISTQLLSPGTHEVDALLDAAYAIEGRSWKGTAGTALELEAALGEFYRRYAHELAARGQLRVDLLSIGGTAVAMQLGAEWRERHWLFKIGYDADYSQASPGQLLLAESVADAATRSLSTYELLGTAAAWTNAWTKQVTECVQVVAFPASRRGVAALGEAAGRKLRRAAIKRARAGVDDARTAGARRYVAGPTLADGLRELAVYTAAGYPTVIGLWDGGANSAAEVSEICFEAAEALPEGAQLAIKLPAMKIREHTLRELLTACSEQGAGLHFDALAPDTATEILAAAGSLADDAGPFEVGCTLAGRWLRSVADADAIRDLPVRVRVVKSEWADPEAPERDGARGCLEVVERLAGREGQVAIATQDASLAASALQRLLAAGTACELQVLHGMDGRAASDVARDLGVPIRVYVPFGAGRLPYDADRHNPFGLLRLTGDLVLPHRSHRLTVGGPRASLGNTVRAAG